MNRRSHIATICALAASVFAASCGPNKDDFGSLEPGASPGGRYQSSLELPPDLADTTSDTVLANRVEPEAPQVLPEIENLDVERNNEEGWIEVNADADLVWQKLVEHWGSLGIELVQADPRIGVMETDWVLPPEAAEDEKKKGALSSALSYLLDDLFDQATSLDKYTIQLERKEGPRTRINVTHRGLKKVQTQEPTKKDNEEFEWVETEAQPGKVSRALTSIAYGLDSDSS